MASFFEPTRGFRRETTAIYDFVTPTAVAMWNLQWQVRGFLAVVPGATKEELQGRFIGGLDAGSDFDFSRANLRRAAKREWSEQTGDFAQVLLLASVALYEGWAAGLSSIFPSSKTRAEQLQFPAGMGRHGGFDRALSGMKRTTSAVMERTLAAPLRNGPKYSLRTLGNLLKCFRYFKECRNCLMHANGKASQYLADASDVMSTLSRDDLGMKAVPEHQALNVGDDVPLSLRGVVGFSDVTYRIVHTIDAELANTAVAEKHFLARWRDTYGRRSLLRDTDARLRQEKRLTINLGLPIPSNPRELDKFLQQKRLVTRLG